MEAQSSKSQSNRYSLTWGEVYARLDRFPSTGRCFGIPRGGAVVAGLTKRAVTNILDADFIVDDIYDSGKTSDKFAGLHPDKPIYYLVDKRHEFQHVWVEFPWEHTQNDMEDTVARQLQYLGQDVNREGLIATPSRVVKSWATLYGGYGMDPKEILSTRFTQENYNQIVLLKDIEMYSTCEHHMLPFYGKAHVAYIPDKFVVGLSKLARLVECFARRFQIQEQLTNQIVDAIEEHLKPKGSACVIEAKHMCMVSRGIQKQNSVMVTSAIRGVFEEMNAKKELMDLIK